MFQAFIKRQEEASVAKFLMRKISISNFSKFWEIELYFNKITGLLLCEWKTPPETVFLQFSASGTADTDTTNDNDMPIWHFQMRIYVHYRRPFFVTWDKKSI